MLGEALTDEADGDRRRDLPVPEPEQPGSAELPDQAEQQAGGAAGRGRGRRRQAHGAVLHGVQGAVGAARRASSRSSTPSLKTDLPAFNKEIREEEAGAGAVRPAVCARRTISPALRLDMPEKRPAVAQDSLLRAVSQTAAVGMLVFASGRRCVGRGLLVPLVASDPPRSTAFVSPSRGSRSGRPRRTRGSIRAGLRPWRSRRTSRETGHPGLRRWCTSRRPSAPRR